MKNKLLYIGASLALLLTGCTDLDTDVKSVYESYPDNEIAQAAVASNCYFAARGLFCDYYTYWGAMTFAGGEAVSVTFNGDYYGNGYMTNQTLHTSLSSDDTMDFFHSLTSPIVTCNKALLTLATEDGSISQTLAQIRAARAFYHWALMETWGDVPILDHLYEDTEAVERQTRSKVMKWIVTELRTVMPYLPKDVNNATYGTPTYWMAQALLAKIYLNYPVYDTTSMDDDNSGVTKLSALDVNSSWSKYTDKLDSCIIACNEVINSGIFDLSDDYRSKFHYNNGSSIKDFIYVMPFDASKEQGMRLCRFCTWRKGQNDGNGGAGLYTSALASSCAGTVAMNPDYAELFCLPGDVRNDQIYGNDEGGIVYRIGLDGSKDLSDPTYYKGKVVTLTKTIDLVPLKNDAGQVIDMGPDYSHLDVGADVNGWTQGWRLEKFTPNPSDYSTHDRCGSNDYPIFRYADVLLMKCEAMTRLGITQDDDDTPESLFNQIRNCAQTITINGNPSLQEIIDERSREFAQECWRRNDLIRYGQYEIPTWKLGLINPTFATDTHKRVFPIPTREMNSNTNWKQNSGY